MDAENSEPRSPDTRPAPLPPPVAPAPIFQMPQTVPVSSGNPAVAHGLAMKRRGPIAVWLGLPLITLGIYHLVWYYKIHKELREYDEKQHGLSPVGSMLVLLLLGWTIVAPLISYYNTGEAIAKAQRSAGIPVTCSPVVSMLLYFVFGLNVWYMQDQLNLIVDAYPNAKPGQEVTLPAVGSMAWR